MHTSSVCTICTKSIRSLAKLAYDAFFYRMSNMKYVYKQFYLTILIPRLLAEPITVLHTLSNAMPSKTGSLDLARAIS